MNRELLEREFDRKFIKKIQGFDYIEIHAVIQRLNDAIGPEDWQFYAEERVVDDEEIVQFGRMGVRSAEGDWIWKSQCGSKKIVYHREKPHTPEHRVDLGNDYKAAISDCIKKCATLLGVGLYLYGEVEEYVDPAAEAMASIQRGEESLAKALETTAEDMRLEFFSEATVLEDCPLDRLQSYLAHLRGIRDARASAGEGTKEPEEPSGSGLGELKNTVLKREKDVMDSKGGTRVALRKKVMNSANLPEDRATLETYLSVLNGMAEAA